MTERCQFGDICPAHNRDCVYSYQVKCKLFNDYINLEGFIKDRHERIKRDYMRTPKFIGSTDLERLNEDMKPVQDGEVRWNAPRMNLDWGEV